MKSSYIVLIVVAILIVTGVVFYYNGNSSKNLNEYQPSSVQTQETSSQSSPTSSEQQQVTSQVAVTIRNFSFTPSTITIKKGETVIWTNTDSVQHTVTSDTGMFDSQPLSQGQSYGHTFTTTGTFSYHCSIHPDMHGTVIVQ